MPILLLFAKAIFRGLGVHCFKFEVFAFIVTRILTVAKWAVVAMICIDFACLSETEELLVCSLFVYGYVNSKDNSDLCSSVFLFSL